MANDPGRDSERAIRVAYDASGAAWRSGPERVYERLAEALLDHAPVPVSGARVLDLGAGTGVASRVAGRRGAVLTVAVDAAEGMLRQRDPGCRAVGADAQVLPFRQHSFDLVVAAFSLGHLPDPVAALREARRVAGAVAASAFAPSWAHPAKQAVDAVMGDYGFTAPEWYVAMKSQESQVEDPESLGGLGVRAGFDEVGVVQVDVDVGLGEPGDLVDWRWGMAHLAPFVAGLSPEVRAHARRDAEAAVVGMPAVVVPMLALSARGAASP